MPRDPVRDRARLGSRGGQRRRPTPGASPRAVAPRWLWIDLGLFIGATGLTVVGILLVWSATRAESGAAVAVKQALAAAIGMVLAAVVTRVDVRLLRAAAPLVYVAALAGLVAVLSPLGRQVNGSRSWISLPGGFTLQPSELMKVALVVSLGMLLAEQADRRQRQRHRDVALAWVLAGLPVVLVLAQPDLGSALVLVAMAVAVIGAAGAPRAWTVAVVLAGAATVTAAFTTSLLSPYQRDRLRAFLDPSLDPQGIGYQTRQVRIAISSGGLDGQGLFEGGQTQAGLIPYQESDFVFSVAGEELGFLGAAGIIVLLGFIVLRALVVARRADAFGHLVSTGVGVWLGVQAVENIGMNLGMLPVTGLPLPFLSYGGSSMIAVWLAVGIVGNVSAETTGAQWRRR
ncbi:rod shape-determining protein RodA [Intrasporangium calvum]|uniref:peptidoglycan glycosyltransferase n=1 Tax=Intrasporangium calvum (strain ATCC 23552 / DSM 43043 / JCM 3097 / NBRC 12989 / NCIMB 10167 / NRRL B-3866 / 7 KIP) TaxID=710696 RepID=E6SE82_INTC7|nr:rod shape-determining protein RodA [Intrasporangium calvum]ADU48730.1 cell cycle protein [Intrasporangium calvum DSM 43043]